MSENDDPKGAGKGDEGAGKQTPDGYVPKADHDKVVSEQAQLKQDLEDMRLEIMTPEYLEFLQGKGKKAEKLPEKSDEPDFSKMTPKEIYSKAKSDAEAVAKAEIESLRSEFTSNSKESVQREIAAFSREHEDFEKYRPLMHGLSQDPKNKDLTLAELYGKAKEHAKGFGPTDDDKKKSRGTGSEKPGGSSNSQKKDTKYTPQSAADEAWDEVVGTEGFPTA